MGCASPNQALAINYPVSAALLLGPVMTDPLGWDGIGIGLDPIRRAEPPPPLPPIPPRDRHRASECGCDDRGWWVFRSGDSTEVCYTRNVEWEMYFVRSRTAPNISSLLFSSCNYQRTGYTYLEVLVVVFESD